MAQEHHILRVRGLPFSCTESELIEFFSKCSVQAVHFTKNREGRPSGDAYIEMNSLRDVKEGLKYDKEMMGTRYLEVFEARYSEMEWMLQKNENTGKGSGSNSNENFNPETDNIIKLRGLPFEAGPPEIIKFFEGLEISEEGILICKDYSGRPSGEAYVEILNEEHLEAAVEKHNENMGHRYIEVFKSDNEEAMRAKERSIWRLGGPGDGRNFGGPSFGGGGGPMRGRFMGGRPGPYDRYGGGGFSDGYFGGPMRGFGYGRGGFGPRGGPDQFGRGGRGYPMMGFGGFGGRGGPGGPRFPGGFGRGGGFGGARMGFQEQRHLVKMRGLPFRVTENEIAEWFSSVADCTDVVIQYLPDGRPSGNAEAVFASEEDAQRAMGRHKQHMQNRYIELFYEGAY